MVAMPSSRLRDSSAISLSPNKVRAYVVRTSVYMSDSDSPFRQNTVLAVTEGDRGSPVSSRDISTYAVSAADDVLPVRPPCNTKPTD